MSSGFLSVLLAVAAGAQPTVRVLPQPSLDSEESTTFEVLDTAGTREFHVALREQLLVVPVQGPAPWQLRCADPALWCQDLLLVEEPGDPWPFPIYRRASLVGRVPRRVAGEAVERITLQGWVKYAADEEPLALALDLPVEEGIFRAEIPHAPIDMRIALPGSAPLYRWNLQPNEEGTLDLGELAPIRGGSLSGFLTAPGEIPTTGAVVRLEPLAVALPPQVADQLRRMDLAAAADRSGFFQLVGVVPGRYRLVAEKDGLRAEEEIEIEVDEELHLRRFPLRGSHRLRVRLSPPQPPGKGRWTVLLSGSGIAPREEVASEKGEVTLEQLHEATYTVAVQTPDHDRVLEKPVMVAGDQALELDTDLIPVRGELRLGGEPLIARLVVMTGDGDATDLESDSHGSIRGWVRRPERSFLRLRVLAPHLGLDRTLEKVGEEVEVEDGVLLIQLDLSAARVQGTVVDEVGQPVQGAAVEAADAWLPAAEASSDLDGSFFLDGLEPGAYWIIARHSRLGASEPVRIELSDSGSTAEVLLAMQPARRLRGTLAAADGAPVSGAQVAISSVGYSFDDLVTTAADGSFEASIILGTSTVSVVVLAPSRFLWAGCQRLDDGALALELPAGPSGELRLAKEWDEELPPVAGSLLLFSDSGGVISADLRRLWSEGRTALTRVAEGLEIEQVHALAPGRWSAANVDEPGWKLLSDGCLAHPVPDRQWTAVYPAAESLLELDLAPLQRRRMEGR